MGESISIQKVDLNASRLVFGFCSKEDAENLLRCVPRSVLLVRFSDIEYAKVKISVKDRNGGFKIKWFIMATV